MIALFQFFRVFGAAPQGLGRFAYMPVALAAAVVYAAWRLRRAIRKVRGGDAR